MDPRGLLEPAVALAEVSVAELEVELAAALEMASGEQSELSQAELLCNLSPWLCSRSPAVPGTKMSPTARIQLHSRMGARSMTPITTKGEAGVTDSGDNKS